MRTAWFVDSRDTMQRDLDDRVFQFACRVVDVFQLLYEQGGAARPRFGCAGASDQVAYRFGLEGERNPGVAVELGWMEVMRRRLGFVGEVYEQEAAGKLARASKLLTTAGAAVLATRGRRSRGAAVAGSALVLAGELALRWSVFRAGFQSARDPRYTVIPQKARLSSSRPLTEG